MLTAANNELRGLDPRPLSRPELVDAIAALDRLIARAEERRLACLAAIDALGDRGADAATVGRSLSRRSDRRAKKDAEVAGRMAEMPAVAGKLASGEITTEHATACADAASRVTNEEADSLAEMAAAMPADLFSKKAREWAGRHESAAAADQRHRQQRRQREASHWTAGDGMVHLHAQFDPITGAAVVASLEERVDSLWRADGGRDGSPAEHRSHGQRRADALAELLTDSGRDAASHPKYMVHLIHELADGTTELADGTPVPDDVLCTLGPAAAVVGHVFSGEGRPLWLGRRTRLASTDQWLALIAAHRGCVDCGATASRCEAHHNLTEWSHGGPTDIDNLDLRCHRCHGVVHRRAERRAAA